jgi:hypothetical protein
MTNKQEDIVMKLIKLFRGAFIVIVVIVAGLCFLSASTANAVAPTVSNLYVPLQGNVTLTNGDVVTFSGQVHVLTRVTFSDAFVPAVQMYVNLIGVEGDERHHRAHVSSGWGVKRRMGRRKPRFAKHSGADIQL